VRDKATMEAVGLSMIRRGRWSIGRRQQARAVYCLAVSRTLAWVLEVEHDPPDPDRDLPSFPVATN